MNVAIRLAEEDFSFMADRMSRWVEGVLSREYHRYRPEQAWSPSINLYEDASAYHLVADLAGIEPEAIDLRVEKKRLVLRGERQSPQPAKAADESPGDAAERASSRAASPAGTAGLRLHHMEIDHGPFLRTVDLPELIDAGRIEASYRNGFLWVKMPKK